MASEQINLGETTLDLCFLMRDLEVLGSELLIAEDADRHQLMGTQQLPLSDRLIRAGLDAQKVERFHAWRHTLWLA
jgi:protein-arginine kinase